MPAREMHRLTNLEQMKVLADPLRIRMLELFGEERTTKQVAEMLGQPPTRLYHHVAALERMGLVRLTRTQQRRGALEKYFLAVARAFTADPRLSSSGKARQVREAAHGVGGAASGEHERRSGRAARARRGPRGSGAGSVLAYLEVRGSPGELKAIGARLKKFIKAFPDPAPSPTPRANPTG
jgi:DNA-binding transcriptional ArsR family regulator